MTVDFRGANAESDGELNNVVLNLTGRGKAWDRDVMSTLAMVRPLMRPERGTPELCRSGKREARRFSRSCKSRHWIHSRGNGIAVRCSRSLGQQYGTGISIPERRLIPLVEVYSLAAGSRSVELEPPSKEIANEEPVESERCGTGKTGS